MKSICVYLGANPGNETELSATVELLALHIAERGIRLVYGGSSQGLMGHLARSIIQNGGRVLGIMPRQLIDKEKPLIEMNELIITESMQQRKYLMQQHADGFIVLPGGLGTLEEAFETWNAIKMGLHSKPLGFLNVNQYFDALFLFLSQCNEKGFLHHQPLSIPHIDADPKKLMDALGFVEPVLHDCECS